MAHRFLLTCGDGVEEVIAARGLGTGYFPMLVNHKGELLLFIRGGAEHVGVNGRIDLIRSQDHGRTWSPPRPVARREWADCRDPSVCSTRDGRLVFTYSVMTGYKLGYVTRPRFADYKFYQFLEFVFVPELSEVLRYYTYSDDDGETWKAPRLLDLKGYKMVSAFAHILELPDGTLLHPIYGGPRRVEVEGDRVKVYNYEAYLARSRDGGESWGDFSLVAKGFGEFSLLEVDGDLIAALRSRRNELYVARSRDKGYTWSEPVRVGSEVEHPADLIRLSNGDILMVFGYRRFPFGVRAILSKDRGRSWTQERLVLAYDAIGEDCGYPTIVNADDGKLVLAYYQVGSHTKGLRERECAAVCLRFDESTVLRAFGR
jgi:hypothetical protein